MYFKIKTTTSLALTCMFILLSASSFGQTNRFSISINSLTTNFNYGKSNAQLAPFKKNFTGLQAGVSYQAGISQRFSIVPEFYFALKGASLKADNPLTKNKSKLRLYNLELPVLARFHLGNLYLNAGPYSSYSFGGRMKVASSASIPAKSMAVSFGDAPGDFKRWDLGLQAGAGYNFNRRKSILTLDIRYGYGLLNVSNDIDRYNRMLNISLAVSKKRSVTMRNK